MKRCKRRETNNSGTCKVAQALYEAEENAKRVLQATAVTTKATARGRRTQDAHYKVERQAQRGQ